MKKVALCLVVAAVLVSLPCFAAGRAPGKFYAYVSITITPDKIESNGAVKAFIDAAFADFKGALVTDSPTWTPATAAAPGKSGFHPDCTWSVKASSPADLAAISALATGLATVLDQPFAKWGVVNVQICSNFDRPAAAFMKAPRATQPK